MPQQILTATENNFTRGLVTEYTGLNFPENAATAASNCEFTLIGDVVRREGINKEISGSTFAQSSGTAESTFQWNNPGGDGSSKLLVRQINDSLYFYDLSAVTFASPISTNQLSTVISVSANVVVGQSYDSTKECQFASGNGYLFVYHVSCEPFYVTFNPITKALASGIITVQIRDFAGTIDGLAVNLRPGVLSDPHLYNLQNQGWTQGSAWNANSSDSVNGTTLIVGNSQSWQVASGIGGITNGQVVTITGRLGGTGLFWNGSGTVVGYSGTTLTLNITAASTNDTFGIGLNVWNFSPSNTGYINTWHTAEGNYPSNADVWWYFKDTTNVFNPSTTQPNVTLSTGNAPQGHYILNAFNINRAAISGVASLTTVSTNVRPSTGCWFQGRVWYTGVNSSQAAASDVNFYTWTENIYFSTIVNAPADFGVCYQQNDPTSELLNGELPTDGGVINVVASGIIHKLWPIANGLIVFANNGVWFITGSQGIGFAATDYTITKISSVKTLSSKSFVDVMGLPYFWNEEGIYKVVTGQSGSLSVEPITVGTILSFYNNIPSASKKYVRGDYNYVDYVIQWTYRSTQETGINDRYNFDTILNYNVYNKAFFPYTISTGGNNQYINGVNYITYPSQNINVPTPVFKYTYSDGSNNKGIAEEYDTTFVDWGSSNYVSSFTTGYKLPGSGLKRMLIPYIYVYSRNPGYLAYYIQGVWDYATSGNTSKISTKQFSEIFDSNTGFVFKRHRIRGRGMALQLQFTSVDGQPFDFVGWALYDNVNTGV